MSRLALPLLVAAVVVSPLLGASAGLAASLDVASRALTVSSKSYGDTTTCQADANADAFVRSDFSGSNAGSSGTLDVDPAALATRRAFARFDLSGCAIPAGAIVHSATLRLTQATSAGSTRTYTAHRATANWTEGGVTWANQPGVAAQSSGSVTVAAGSSSGAVIAWSVIGDVQAFVSEAQTNFGWRVADSAEGTLLGHPLSWRSREAASGRPTLEIVYVR